MKCNKFRTYHISLSTSHLFRRFCYVCRVLSENLASVRHRIEAACRRSKREPDDVKLVAVSKTHPAAVLHEAIVSGISIFGENKVQEAEAKIEEIGRDGVQWHMIGHLQSNKARRAVELFDVIESLDSLELARKLERFCKENGRDLLPVFIQVDLAAERTRSGVAEGDLAEMVAYLSTCERLRLDGLMLLPPYFDDAELARPYFRRLRELRDSLDFGASPLGLSMGMSHDFEVAIEEGATVVRVGTALFGSR